MIRPNLTINCDRLWSSLMEMAQIGATQNGGCNRQALTEEDRQGRALFKTWCEAAGATVRTDPLGSMFARIEGSEDLPPLLIGSHLDTQPTGGKFDGVLGVLAGIEILRCLRETGFSPRRPIEIVNWTNEEGCRFAPAMLASAAFSGALPLESALGARDAAGVLLGDALAQIGIEPDTQLGGRGIFAYLELHIEQGPLLEAQSFDVGIVTGGQGLRWYDVSIVGFDAHAGATPMARRRDALVAAAGLIGAINQIGLEVTPDGMATVGQFVLFPNSRNVIPGRVEFSVDLRSPDPAVLAAMDQRLREVVLAAAAGGIETQVADVVHTPPTQFDGGLAALLRAEADILGLVHRDIISGAGHDACHIAKIAPSVMIFTPCRDGISHNETEDISQKWASDGANLLLRAALRLTV